MYAIVETGGKQYKLEEGRYVDIELLDAQADDKVTFDKVVMLVNGKKCTRVKQGHRQQFTRVMVNKINTKAKSAKSEETTGEE